MNRFHICRAAGLTVAILIGFGLVSVLAQQEVELVVVNPSDVAKGFPVRELLNRAVYNDKNESIGTVQNFVIAPQKKASFAVIDVGDFLVTSPHLVAVPAEKLVFDKPGMIVLPGASRDALRKLPVVVPPTSP